MATRIETATRDGLKHVARHAVVNDIRDRAREACKSFKVSWVALGQILHAIQEDRLYHAWVYETFEDYTIKELGFDNRTATKLLKSYVYLIDEASEYLKEDFSTERGTKAVPSIDEINFLRLAKGKRDLRPEDQAFLKRQVFEKGRVGEDLRRDLTALMRERKTVDPIQEKELRKARLIKGLINNLALFHFEMRASKLVPYDIIKDAEDLLNRLKAESARS